MMKGLKKLARSGSDSALLRSSKSTSGARLMAAGSMNLDDAGYREDDEERGLWHYLVVDINGIRPRSETSYSKETKASSAPRIREGTIVEVVARRKTILTTWLSVSSGAGWLHDISPKDYSVRMVEVELDRGMWEYQVGAERVNVIWGPTMQGVHRPTQALRAILEPNEVVSICERVRPLNGAGTFLRLADGRGYAFDVIKGQQVIFLNRASKSSPSRHGAPTSFSPSTGQDLRMGASADFMRGQDFRMGASPDFMRGQEMEAQFADQLSEPSPLSPLELSPLGKGNGAVLGPGERGEWDYVVLEPAGISVRDSPTFDASTKNGSRLLQGDIVKAIERRRCNGSTFLRLESPAGWVFDLHQRLTNQRQRMAPVQVEEGVWYYRVATKNGVALRKRCALDDASKVGKGPSQGAVLCVVKRVRLGGVTFSKLKDEEAWIPDCKDGKKLLEGPIDMQIVNRSGSVKSDCGVNLLVAPTRNRWAQTKRVLLKGAAVQVLRTCEAEGETWAFISPAGGGMEGWSFHFNFNIDEPPPVSASPTRMCDRGLIQRAWLVNNPVGVA